MNLDAELRLSFYKEIASVNMRHGVTLVQHTDTGSIYVKKSLKHYDQGVFEFIKEEHCKGIPVIHELIESDDELIVIEDYINGRSLDEIMSDGIVSEDEAVRIIVSLCDILSPLHSHVPSFIHRDIKGSNIIIDNENNVYLIDFDASKTVTEGKNRDTDLIGTEEYAAPEQYGFGQSDQRTDIYAIGILLNKMLTGKLPMESRYEGSLAHVIDRATAIDPEKRYRNVQSLKTAINSHSSSEGRKANNIDQTNNQTKENSHLKKLLSHLPYPIRELPGFRSGNPIFLTIALAGYGLLIAFGFFGTSSLPQYTPAQNRFYDIATFLLFIVPILYLGNYLGIRDRAPWKKSNNRTVEYIRIGVGTIASVLLVIVVVTIASMLLNF